MADPTVSAGNAASLIELAVSEGASRAALHRRSGIDPERLRDQDNRVTMSEYHRLMLASKELTGDPAFGLRFGKSVHMQEFSILGLIFHACETVRDAIVQANRYGQLVIDVDVGTADRFQWQRRNGQLWLVDTRPDPNDFPELTEVTFGRFMRLTRPFWDTPLVREVNVTHPAPGYQAEYDRYFESPTTFSSGWNAMRVEEARLTQQIAVQPRYAFGILSEHADHLLQSLEGSKSTRGRVESLLMPILHTGTASMELIADKLAVSRQTLYRQLKAEGVTFETVLDELRHKLALHYLGGQKTSVNETAYLVGFSEPAAFSRAFKRWTGNSPRAAYRLQAAAPSPGSATPAGSRSA
ncbi:AraC family transcriptional regulator [Lysobacter korlensis]|uniref:AraC family transcriptional regulator n=1 Tax=Lysobacter korlensis TaxID=553636 RepID=A0ABV6RUH7_9GAMM